MEALVRSVRGFMPQFGKNIFLAETAVVVGEVTMGDDCTVWYGAVVRGDVHYIKIGNKVNVQDGAVLHCTYQKHPLNIGNNVSIGHRAMVHGCTIEDNVLIGMGSIVMDNVYIEKNAVIAAGAVVLENTRVESGTIYAGVPAKKVKELSAEHFKDLNERIANNYVMYASWFKEEN
jgi:carbonic anhydrase/acetyltransferase-like protein (isoleucine patch superfamily)